MASTMIRKRNLGRICIGFAIALLIIALIVGQIIFQRYKTNQRYLLLREYAAQVDQLMGSVRELEDNGLDLDDDLVYIRKEINLIHP